MTTDPERKKQTQRLDCYEADQLLNLWLKNCALFIAWMLTFLAGLLIGGCR
jgi:hypothetical protein